MPIIGSFGTLAHRGFYLISAGGTAGEGGTTLGIQEVFYSTPGTYTWICPANVYSVSAVCIGGGGVGQYRHTDTNTTAWSNAGGGGGLGWKNGIAVWPGESYTVTVGHGGKYVHVTNSTTSGIASQDSYFISKQLVMGGKGEGGYVNTPTAGGFGGTYVGDGGGNGGQGGAEPPEYIAHYQFGGGGGAGGYTGNGGDGSMANWLAAQPGQGGGGGGGQGASSAQSSYLSGYGYRGGGVYAFGEGENGVAGKTPGDGETNVVRYGGHGSYKGVVNPSTLVEVSPGGWGGEGHWTYITYTSLAEWYYDPVTKYIDAFQGGDGQVRLVWDGDTRKFPNTFVEPILDEALMPPAAPTIPETATAEISASTTDIFKLQPTSTTLTVNTTDVPDDGRLFIQLVPSTTGNPIVASDITGFNTAGLRGSFAVTNNVGTFDISGNLTAKTFPKLESESFSVEIYREPEFINLLTATPEITVHEPVLSIDKTYIDEGVNTNINVTGANISPGTYDWYVNHITTANADFVANTLAGNFTLSGTFSSSTGVFTLQPVNDSTLEGNQTFSLSIKSSNITLFESDALTLYDPVLTSIVSPESINEGSAGTFTVYGEHFPISSSLYWTINHVNTANADFSATTGSFTVTNNTGTFNVGTVADSTTEGAQTFTVSVRLTSTSGVVLGTSDTVTINDTSMSPDASFVIAPTTVNEGTTTTYSVVTSNFTSGSLYWTIQHGTTTSADFSASSGSFAISGSVGSFTITTVADASTEGNQTFTIALRLGSISGTVLDQTGTITLADTSTTPPGQVLHATPGSISWICPGGVTSISVVAIGGGGGGVGFNSTSINQGGAGGGGALVYKNGLSVTPGVTYTLLIPPTDPGYSGGSPYYGGTGTNAGDGSDPVMKDNTGTAIMGAPGGHGGRGQLFDSAPYTGTLQGGLGGAGGSPTNDPYVNFGTNGVGGQGGFGNGLVAAGGGGAGGYLGATGGVGAGTNSATPGAGGGSGAGAGGARSTSSGTTGTNGTGASVLGTSPGGGTLYGYGGAAGWGVSGLRGGNAAIRIMWGSSRTYPSSNVADQ